MPKLNDRPRKKITSSFFDGACDSICSGSLRLPPAQTPRGLKRLSKNSEVIFLQTLRTKVLQPLWLVLAIAAVPATAPAMQQGSLTIETADGRSLPFAIELAQTRKELEIGLMNRSSLGPDAGMLFDFGGVQQVNMWMENTLIPLDMVFIGEDGRVAGVAERAIPMSRAIIASPGPIRAVLEINGGTADRLHIAIGDKVVHGIFKH